MCKRLLICALMLVAFVGCRQSDFMASVVIEGQPAPHDGYNVGPDLFVCEGDPVIVSGAVIWIKGLDPNDIMEALEGEE